MHIRRERKKRLSKLLAAWRDKGVHVLRMGGIKIPCPRPEVDESLIRGSGTDDKFRKERNVDGLGVNMIFGLGLGDFMNMRSWHLSICMADFEYMIASDKRRIANCKQESRIGEGCSY